MCRPLINLFTINMDVSSFSKVLSTFDFVFLSIVLLESINLSFKKNVNF